jgi:uncharacterized protein YjbJ (UPF0337 family)
MAGEPDKVTGRAKEAAGAIADDDKLRHEGKMEQAAGEVKEKIAQGVDKVKQAVQKDE